MKMTSKQRKLEKIRKKNNQRKLEAIKENKKSFHYENGEKVKVGDKIKCTKSLKVFGLPGGFTKGSYYEILFLNRDEISFTDDDKESTHDLMELNSYFIEEFFGINISKY